MRNNLASAEGEAYSGHAMPPEMDMTEKPPKPGFDTMKGLKRLEEGGLDRPAAEAIVLFAEEATANLATKDQVARVREDLGKDIARVREDLGKDIARVREDLGKEVVRVREDLGKEVVRVREDLGKDIQINSQRQTIQLGGMVIAAVFVVCGFVAWMIETRGVPPQQPAVQQAKH